MNKIPLHHTSLFFSGDRKRDLETSKQQQCMQRMRDRTEHTTATITSQKTRIISIEFTNNVYGVEKKVSLTNQFNLTKKRNHEITER